MSILNIRPYVGIGSFSFGTKRDELRQKLGEAKSTCMYGFPMEDRYLDDYGHFHILCNKNELLEAVELFPALVPEETMLEFAGKRTRLSVKKETFLSDIRLLAGDLCPDDEGESYYSTDLGLKIYCPYDEVEDIIFHDKHCYDEENEYLQGL